MHTIPIINIENGIGLGISLSHQGTAALIITTPATAQPSEVNLTREEWKPLFDVLYPFVWRIIALTDVAKWELRGHTVLFKRHKNEELVEIVIDEIHRCYALYFTVNTLCNILGNFFDFTPPPISHYVSQD